MKTATTIGTAEDLASQYPELAADIRHAAAQVDSGKATFRFYQQRGPNLLPLEARMWLSVLRQWETPGVPEFVLEAETDLP